MSGRPVQSSTAHDRVAYVLYSPQGPRPLDGLQIESVLQPAAPQHQRPRPTTRRALLRRGAEVTTVYDKVSRSQLLHIPPYTSISFLAVGNRRGGVGPSSPHRVVVLQFRSGGVEAPKNDLATAPPAAVPAPFEALTITFTVADASGTRRVVMSSSVREVQRHAHHVKLPLRCLPRERWVNLFVDIAALYHNLLLIPRDHCQARQRSSGTPADDHFRLTRLQVSGNVELYVRRVLSLHALPEALYSETNQADGVWRGGKMAAETALILLPCLEPLRLAAEVQEEAVFLSLRSGHEPFLTESPSLPNYPVQNTLLSAALAADEAILQTPSSSSHVAPPPRTTSAISVTPRAANSGLRQRCTNEPPRHSVSTLKTSRGVGEMDDDARLVAELRARLRPALSPTTSSPPTASLSSSSSAQHPMHSRETRHAVEPPPTAGGTDDVEVTEEETDDERFVVQAPHRTVCSAHSDQLDACNNTDRADEGIIAHRALSSQKMMCLLQQRIAHLNRILDNAPDPGRVTSTNFAFVEPPCAPTAAVARSGVAVDEEDDKCGGAAMVCAGHRSERVRQCDKAVQTDPQAAAAASLTPWAPFSSEPVCITRTRALLSGIFARDAHDDTVSVPTSTATLAARDTNSGEAAVKTTWARHHSTIKLHTKALVQERTSQAYLPTRVADLHSACVADADTAQCDTSVLSVSRREMATSWSFHSDPDVVVDGDDDILPVPSTHLAETAACGASSSAAAARELGAQATIELTALARHEACGTPATRPYPVPPIPPLAEDSVQISGPSSPVCDAAMVGRRTRHARVATTAPRRPAPLPRHPDVSETPRMRAARLNTHANSATTSAAIVAHPPPTATSQDTDLSTAIPRDGGGIVACDTVRGAVASQRGAAGAVWAPLRTPALRKRDDIDVTAQTPSFSVHSTPSSFRCISPSQLPLPGLQVSRYEGSLMSASTTMPEYPLANTSQEEGGVTRGADFVIHRAVSPAPSTPSTNKPAMSTELIYDSVVRCYLDLQTNQYVFGSTVSGGALDSGT